MEEELINKRYYQCNYFFKITAVGIETFIVSVSYYLAVMTIAKTHGVSIHELWYLFRALKSGSWIRNFTFRISS